MKNTAFSINRDFPQEIVSARKGLWPEFKNVRQAYPDKRVNLVYPAKIIIDGRVHANAFPDWDPTINRSRIHSNSTPTTQSASSLGPRVSPATHPVHSSSQPATTTPINTCPISDLHNSRDVSAPMQIVDASTDKPAVQQQECVPANGTQVNHALHVQPNNPRNCTQSPLIRAKSATPRARQESKSPNPARRQRQQIGRAHV